ncbi:MAG: OmpA family protein [Gemmatimonadales bacterium]|nr:MAG: OmpA family protein [Gemmatimonadales bacterium]
MQRPTVVSSVRGPRRPALPSRPTLRRTGRIGLYLAAALVLTSCSSWGQRETGAVVGAAAGGAVGGIVGTQSGSTARGAIIGAVVGGAAGAVIGHQMDRQAEELEARVPGAIVERVGEGIHVTFPSGLLFDFDSHAVRPDAAGHLRQLATSLGTYPDTRVVVVGHTDSVGSDTYNHDLSLRRAGAASNVLLAQGVSAGRIDIVGRGEWEPLATNETAAGRQANRRVEVAIFSDGASSVQP